MENTKPVSIKDVAKHAKVALATVDRVVHNRNGVSEKTKEKVLKVIKELNYQPNFMASNLSKRKTIVFGVLLPNVSTRSTYWELPLKGIQRAKNELYQYNIAIEQYLYDQSDSQDIRKQILKVVNSGIHGLVLTPKFAQETTILLQDCVEKNRPYIFIDSNIKTEGSLCSIHQPLYESGQLAAQLFNYCFHKGKILIVHLKDAMDSEDITDEKIKGLLGYLSETGSSIETEKVKITNFSPENIKQTIDNYLTKSPDINGIFIPNSKIGHIARYLVEKREKRIYLIGYDYLKENYEYINKGIIDFLICQRPEDQGYKAIYKLFEHLVLKKNIQKEIVMPLDIITKSNHKYY